MNTPFEITKDEVLNLAAQKLADAYAADSELGEQVDEIVKSKVEDYFNNRNVKQRIDDALSAEIDRLLGVEIHPVNIWGESEGQATTIRAELARRAKEFWSMPVDEQGREASFRGTPRSELLMKKLLKEEFEKAVKTNAEVIVAEFKKALLVDANRIVTENINRLIKWAD